MNLWLIVNAESCYDDVIYPECSIHSNTALSFSEPQLVAGAIYLVVI